MQWLYFLFIKKVPKIKGCHGLGMWEENRKRLGTFFEVMELTVLYLDCGGGGYTTVCLSNLIELDTNKSELYFIQIIPHF